MKKTYLLLALTFVLALVGCQEEEKHATPKVALEAVESLPTSLVFKVTPENAETCAYVCYENGTTAPTASAVLANGVSVDAKKTSSVTVSDLKPNTEYNIVVAAQAGDVAVLSQVLKMKTTDAAVPVVTLEAGSVTRSSISFVVKPQDATACAYVVLNENEAPAAADILANGTAVAANESSIQTVSDLEPGVTYYVFAAATNGVASVVSDVLEMTTKLNESDIVEIYGRKWNRFNFGFNIYTSKGEQAFVDMYLQETSVAGVLPEGEYKVLDLPEPPMYEAEENCIAAQGSFIRTDRNAEDYNLLQSGRIIITHVDKGYIVDVDLTDEQGNRIVGVYEGYVPPQFEQEQFCNPPIPWHDETYETTLTYVGAQHYSDPGTSFSFWMKTADGPYDIYFNLLFPKVMDGILPEGLYTLKTTDWESDEEIDELVIFAEEGYHHAQLEDQIYMRLLEGSTLEVEHLDGEYRLTLDIENELKTKIKATWEGVIEKRWDADPDINHPGQGEEIAEMTVKGVSNSSTAYTLYMEAGDKKLELAVNCPGSVWNVLPEGEYIVDPNADEWAGSSLSNFFINGAKSKMKAPYTKTLVSGKLIVSHLEEGYDMYVDVRDTEGNRFKAAYKGIVDPYTSNATFNNPPIPYNDITINTTFTSVTGSHDAPLRADGWFDLYFTTAEGPYDIQLQLECPIAYDGILKEGTYTLGGEELIIHYGSMTLRGASSLELTDATLEVRHLDVGYEMVLHVEDQMKTKINATHTGIVLKSDNASYDFQNPGYRYPADYKLDFETVKIGTTDGMGGRYVTMSNSHGDRLKISFHEDNVSISEITPGLYTYTYQFEDDPFTYYGNGTTLTMPDVPNPYPFYAGGGMIEVLKHDDGTYTIDVAVYIYQNGHKLVRSTYTGIVE